MAKESSHIQEHFRELPEPAHARAIEIYFELRGHGYHHPDALEKAALMAHKWIDERAPGAVTEGADGDEPVEMPHDLETTPELSTRRGDGPSTESG